MTSTREISERRRRRSGGNTFIEWMFTLLPSMALLTFFFDVSFAMFSWTTIQNAVREGCRYAVTFQTSGSLGQDDSIKQVIKQYSMGLISTSNASLMQVNYYSTLAPNTAIASPAGNVPGNIVEISIQGYPIQWLFPISGTLANPFRSTSPAAVNVYSTDVLGGYPAGVTSVTRWETAAPCPSPLAAGRANPATRSSNSRCSAC